MFGAHIYPFQLNGYIKYTFLYSSFKRRKTFTNNLQLRIFIQLLFIKASISICLKHLNLKSATSKYEHVLNKKQTANKKARKH